MNRTSDRHQATDTHRMIAEEIATVERVMAVSASVRPPVLGAPTRCPECGGWGTVEVVRPGAVMNRCRRCDASWLLTARAVLAVAQRIHDAGCRSRHPSTGDGAVRPNAAGIVDLRTRPRFRGRDTLPLHLASS